MTTRPAITPPNLPLPTTHTLALRPRYCECDPMGVVHHAAYVPWFEMGRTELLRAGGLSYAQLEAMGVLLAIIDLQVRYKRSARYDDQLELVTTVSGGSRVKILHGYELRLVQPAVPDSHWHGEAVTILTASTTLACIDRSGRPQALPDWLAQ